MKVRPYFAMQKVQKLLKTPYFLQADLQALTPGRVKKMTLYNVHLARLGWDWLMVML